MPIDASIPLQAKTPHFMGPQDVLSLQSLLAQSQMNQLKVRQAEEARQSMDALRTFYSDRNNFDEKGYVKPDRMNAMMALNPLVGEKIMDSESTRRMREAQLSTQTRLLQEADRKAREAESQRVSLAGLSAEMAKPTEEQTLAGLGLVRNPPGSAHEFGIANPKAYQQAQQTPFNIGYQSPERMEQLRLGAVPLSQLGTYLRSQQRPEQYFAAGGQVVSRNTGLPGPYQPPAKASSASPYTNVTPDGKGGYNGLNKKTGRIEKVPMAEDVVAQGGLDEAGLKVAAWENLLFGKNPPGLGNASAAQRAQVLNERARIGKSLGLSEMEMAMMPQDNKVKMKAVDVLTRWGATVGRSAEKLDLDLKVALDYAAKLPLQTIQLVNKGVIAGMKEFNDPDANAYASALNSVRMEYARLMSGPTSNAMLPVEAMKTGNELISKGVNLEALREVGIQMRRDAANTMTATNNQISSLRDSIQSLGRAPSFRETPPEGRATSPATGWTPEKERRYQELLRKRGNASQPQ